MSNLLNLDEIEVGDVKTFKFKEQTHTMVPLSVGEYIKQVKELDALQASEDGGHEAQFLFMIKSVRAAFPTMSQEHAEAMTFPQLQMLMQHIQGDVTEEMERGNES